MRFFDVFYQDESLLQALVRRVVRRLNLHGMRLDCCSGYIIIITIILLGIIFKVCIARTSGKTESRL